MANKDSYRPSRGVSEPRVVPRGEGVVRTILLRVGMNFLHGVCLLREIVVGVLGLGMVSLLDAPSLVANTSIGGMIATLCLKGATDHGLHLVVLVVLQGDVWVFHRANGTTLV
jgi:hypothetical protein